LGSLRDPASLAPSIGERGVRLKIGSRAAKSGANRLSTRTPQARPARASELRLDAFKPPRPTSLVEALSRPTILLAKHGRREVISTRSRCRPREALADLLAALDPHSVGTGTASCRAYHLMAGPGGNHKWQRRISGIAAKTARHGGGARLLLDCRSRAFMRLLRKRCGKRHPGEASF